MGVEREEEPGYDTAVYVHRQSQPRAGGSPLRPPLIMSTRVWSIWRTSSDHAVFRLAAPVETRCAALRAHSADPATASRRPPGYSFVGCHAHALMSMAAESA